MGFCCHLFVYNPEFSGYPDEPAGQGDTIADFRLYGCLFFRTNHQPRSFCKDHGRSIFASDPDQTYPEKIPAGIRLYRYYKITEETFNDCRDTLMAYCFCYKHEPI